MRTDDIQEIVHDVQNGVDSFKNTADDVKDAITNLKEYVETIRREMLTSIDVKVIRSTLEMVTKEISSISLTLRNQIRKSQKSMYR